MYDVRKLTDIPSGKLQREGEDEIYDLSCCITTICLVCSFGFGVPFRRRKYDVFSLGIPDRNGMITVHSSNQC